MLDFADNPLVETDWLAEHLDHPNLRVVDCRWRGDGSGRQRYLQGHIPGAVHLDWHADLNHTQGIVQDLLLPPDAFAQVMSRVGIGDETRVVAYDETDYSGAARLWWALQLYGHAQVTVLNGGLTKWLGEGRPLSKAVPVTAPAHFTPRPRPELLATAEEIERALAQPQTKAILVDCRPPEQYEGRAVWTPMGSYYLPSDEEWVDVGGRLMRSGRLPRARHLHSVRNLDPEASWTFRSPERLRQLALAAGIEPDRRVITYCGVGISASLTLFALHLAGYRDLALYDASWSEWGTDPKRPVERD